MRCMSEVPLTTFGLSRGLPIALVFCLVGCGSDAPNSVLEIEMQRDLEPLSAFFADLPMQGSDDRFDSFEAMQATENDLEEIAYYLSIFFDQEDTRGTLHQLLQERDAYGEISFNDFLISRPDGITPVYSNLKQSGLEKLNELVTQHPELRLSIPEKFDETFDAFSDFIVVVSPVVDERFVEDLVAFTIGGERIQVDPVELTEDPILALEIDENPYNHPTKMESEMVIAVGKEKYNPPVLDLADPSSFLSRSASSSGILKVKLTQVRLYNKLEGTWNRAEFNVSVTAGTIVSNPYGGSPDYSFPTAANRGFGITEVNWADKNYSVNRYVYDYGPDVIGLCVWEDDPGGKDKYTYYAGDNRWQSDCSTFEHGYLDAHPNNPDDLYGHIHLEWEDMLYAWENSLVLTTYAYGYNSSRGGNAAYDCEYPEDAKKNARLKLKMYEN